MVPLEQRFWAKVDKTGQGGELHLDGDPCWLWTGAQGGPPTGRYGYIQRGRRGEGLARVHRLSYEWTHGPIPDGLEPDHLCGHTLCVNPAHLEAVTGRENRLRSSRSISERYAERTHCKNGHEFTPENTYWMRQRGKAYRRCRACALTR